MDLGVVCHTFEQLCNELSARDTSAEPPATNPNSQETTCPKTDCSTCSAVTPQMTNTESGIYQGYRNRGKRAAGSAPLLWIYPQGVPRYCAPCTRWHSPNSSDYIILSGCTRCALGKSNYPKILMGRPQGTCVCCPKSKVQSSKKVPGSELALTTIKTEPPPPLPQQPLSNP